MTRNSWQAPIGAVTRTEYFDEHGVVYGVEWGTGAPPATLGGRVTDAAGGAPGSAPVGDTTRTVFYDDRGEAYYVLWQACPPSIPPKPIATPTSHRPLSPDEPAAGMTTI